MTMKNVQWYSLVCMFSNYLNVRHSYLTKLQAGGVHHKLLLTLM